MKKLSLHLNILLFVGFVYVFIIAIYYSSTIYPYSNPIEVLSVILFIDIIHDPYYLITDISWGFLLFLVFVHFFTKITITKFWEIIRIPAFLATFHLTSVFISQAFVGGCIYIEIQNTLNHSIANITGREIWWENGVVFREKWLWLLGDYTSVILRAVYFSAAVFYSYVFWGIDNKCRTLRDQPVS